MKLRLVLGASSALLLTATPAWADHYAAAQITAEALQSEHDKLFALFDDADARELALNPLGRLSRGVVGVRGRSIIVNTPGSPKGCVEQLVAVLDVLPHALALVAETPTDH